MAKIFKMIQDLRDKRNSVQSKINKNLKDTAWRSNGVDKEGAIHLTGKGCDKTMMYYSGGKWKFGYSNDTTLIGTDVEQFLHVVHIVIETMKDEIDNG